MWFSGWFYSALVGVPPAEPPTDKGETPASPALKQILRPVSSRTRSAWRQVERRGQLNATCSDPEKQLHGNTLPEASNCSPTMGSFQRQQCFPISVSKAADIFYAHECQACYTKWIFTDRGQPRNLPTLHQPPLPPYSPHSALAGLQQMCLEALEWGFKALHKAIVLLQDPYYNRTPTPTECSVIVTYFVKSSTHFFLNLRNRPFHRIFCWITSYRSPGWARDRDLETEFLTN